jgi:hypothetical protein
MFRGQEPLAAGKVVFRHHDTRSFPKSWAQVCDVSCVCDFSLCLGAFSESLW